MFSTPEARHHRSIFCQPFNQAIMPTPSNTTPIRLAYGAASCVNEALLCLVVILPLGLPDAAFCSAEYAAFESSDGAAECSDAEVADDGCVLVGEVDEEFEDEEDDGVEDGSNVSSADLPRACSCATEGTILPLVAFVLDGESGKSK